MLLKQYEIFAGIDKSATSYQSSFTWRLYLLVATIRVCEAQRS